MKWHIYLRCGIVLVAVLGALSARSAVGDARKDGPLVALGPLAVHALGVNGDPVLSEMLEQALDELEVRYLSEQEIRPVLRASRIRSRGGISKIGAQRIREATGADLLLLGSWDVYRKAGFPEVAVSLRLLDLESLELVGAASAGSTGDDQLGLFEQGRISDLETLSLVLLKTTLKELLEPKSQSYNRVLPAGFEKLAVVPLNNYSETNYADRILANVVLSELHSAGYFVVEPGFVREVELLREEANRGGIGRSSATALFRGLGVEGVVTGTLDSWHPARGQASGAVPQLAFGLRLVDARTCQVKLAREYAGAGNDHDGLFWQGRQRSLVEVAKRLAGDFVHDLKNHLKEDHVHD
jgi:curli biogenesis system outer membrane secretion channel CsgG